MGLGAGRPGMSTPVLAVVLCLVWSSAFIFIKPGSTVRPLMIMLIA